jgi:hypothetical protein
MPHTAQEVYQQDVLPLSEKERLRLAALIINDISKEADRGRENKRNRGLKELFGSVSLGHSTGLDNEKMDADLARDYGSSHEDE